MIKCHFVLSKGTQNCFTLTGDEYNTAYCSTAITSVCKRLGAIAQTVFQLGLFLRALRPARTGLRPARFARAMPEFNKKRFNFKNKKLIYFLFKKNVIAVFVFSDSRCKNACKMLADLCPCFHQSPTRPNFGRSRVRVCRLRTKLCPNFGHSCARLCPISFAPCPFPNLAGTLTNI